MTTEDFRDHVIDDLVLECNCATAQIDLAQRELDAIAREEHEAEGEVPGARLYKIDLLKRVDLAMHERLRYAQLASKWGVLEAVNRRLKVPVRIATND